MEIPFGIIADPYTSIEYLFLCFSFLSADGVQPIRTNVKLP